MKKPYRRTSPKPIDTKAELERMKALYGAPAPKPTPPDEAKNEQPSTQIDLEDCHGPYLPDYSDHPLVADAMFEFALEKVEHMRQVSLLRKKSQPKEPDGAAVHEPEQQI